MTTTTNQRFDNYCDLLMEESTFHRDLLPMEAPIVVTATFVNDHGLIENEVSKENPLDYDGPEGLEKSIADVRRELDPCAVAIARYNL